MLPDRTGMASRAKVPQCGTPSGFTAHIKHGTEPCIPCREAKNQYQTAYGIRKGSKTWLQVRVSVLKELLDGGDVTAILERERGAEVVAAIRNSGTVQAEVPRG